jgi:hypothetical protein
MPNLCGGPTGPAGRLFDFDAATDVKSLYLNLDALSKVR